MKIGFMELMIIFIVALFVIGPDKLPSYAKKLGIALREFKKATADVAKDVRENVIDPLEEAQKPLRDAIEPLEELDKEVRRDIKAVKKELKDLGKPTAKAPEKEEPQQETSESENPKAGEEPVPQREKQIDEYTGGENI